MSKHQLLDPAEVQLWNQVRAAEAYQAQTLSNQQHYKSGWLAAGGTWDDLQVNGNWCALMVAHTAAINAYTAALQAWSEALQ